jgi:SAM-dependent methyltransferase
MHHMSDPAALLDRIAPALRGGGLLFLDDYVGPSRDQWPAVDLSLAQAAYDKLPRPWRTVETLSPPFDASDPSEMIRSDAILPAVRAHFEILWERPYWGNILFPVLSNVVEAEAGAADAEGILSDLIAYERRLVREGVIETPYFVWITGRKEARRVILSRVDGEGSVAFCEGRASRKRVLRRLRGSG